MRQDDQSGKSRGGFADERSQGGGCVIAELLQFALQGHLVLKRCQRMRGSCGLSELADQEVVVQYHRRAQKISVAGVTPPAVPDERGRGRKRYDARQWQPPQPTRLRV